MDELALAGISKLAMAGVELRRDDDPSISFCLLPLRSALIMLGPLPGPLSRSSPPLPPSAWRRRMNRLDAGSRTRCLRSEIPGHFAVGRRSLHPDIRRRPAHHRSVPLLRFARRPRAESDLLLVKLSGENFWVRSANASNVDRSRCAIAINGFTSCSSRPIRCAARRPPLQQKAPATTSPAAGRSTCRSWHLFFPGLGAATITFAQCKARQRAPLRSVADARGAG